PRDQPTSCSMPRPPGAPWNITIAGNGPLPFGLRIAEATYAPSFDLIHVGTTGETFSLTTWMYFASGNTASLPGCCVISARAAIDTSNATLKHVLRMTPLKVSFHFV